MKKTLLITLLLLIIFLSGCNPQDDSYLEYHFTHFASQKTYGIAYQETKGSLGNYQRTHKYVYVDNENDIWTISNHLKSDGSLETDDIVFAKENNQYHQFRYLDNWVAYDQDDTVLSVKHFETPFYQYLKGGETINNNKKIILKNTMTLEDVDQNKYYDLFGIDIPAQYHTIPFTLQATYSTTNDIFESFTLDFSQLLTKMYDDRNITVFSPIWKIEITYMTELTDFSLSIPETLVDDHMNLLDPFQFIKLVTSYSYELIKGVIDYENDIDMMHVIFDKTDRYQLSFRELVVPTQFVVKIYDQNMRIVEEIIFDGNDTSTYYPLNKGEYYISIESTSGAKDIAYELLFKTH